MCVAGVQKIDLLLSLGLKFFWQQARFNSVRSVSRSFFPPLPLTPPPSPPSVRSPRLRIVPHAVIAIPLCLNNGDDNTTIVINIDNVCARQRVRVYAMRYASQPSLPILRQYNDGRLVLGRWILACSVTASPLLLAPTYVGGLGLSHGNRMRVCWQSAFAALDTTDSDGDVIVRWDSFSRHVSAALLLYIWSTCLLISV